MLLSKFLNHFAHLSEYGDNTELEKLTGTHRCVRHITHSAKGVCLLVRLELPCPYEVRCCLTNASVGSPHCLPELFSHLSKSGSDERPSERVTPDQATRKSTVVVTSGRSDVHFTRHWCMAMIPDSPEAEGGGVS